MEQERSTLHSLRPLVFGEVLYDSFPDGSVVLGGAPFNVAWHLQGFGLAPVFVSRIGTDELGERVLAAMSAWGMDVRGVQKDPVHATGRVVVSLHDHEPSYDIVPEQAYDFIEEASVADLLRDSRYGLLYHGSLIARHAAARAALDTLRSAGIPSFVDVNLRDPWWQRQWLDAALRQARWAKLNEHELRIVMGGDEPSTAELDKLAEQFQRSRGLQVVVVTRGQAGALILTDEEKAEVAPVVAGELVDTVGAGDAFSAVSIMGLLSGWPVAVLAERAVEFAAELCRMRGATGQDRGLYERYLRKWGA
ncbi:MAG: PfkB family carbohydrate kinase [Gammaproteobacteria bacterium]|jgi:fructokinase